MRRRKARKAAQPFDPLEVILATSPANRRFAHFAREITAERWREHGADVMRKVDEERDEQRRLYGPGCKVTPAWCWLLWGDPAGYTSPPGARRTALLEEIAGLEHVVVNGHGTEEIAETLAELRQALTDLNGRA